MKTNITTINLNLSCQQGDLYEKERGFGLHDSFPSKQIFLKDLFIESIKKNVEWINQGLPRIDNIGSENEEERKEFLPLNSKLFHDIIKNQDLVSDRSIQLKTPSSLKKVCLNFITWATLCSNFVSYLTRNLNLSYLLRF